ncbi:MAG: diguanylate cyclase/phosphodiesterase (GGDEF & EAL domains) with PAS/PAC sensor(s) [uncultured Rubrobacteraceae bacterium]|uniref:Sensor-like histidine kinase SenX3 n=1 Tax=uncultured Rubrobacteraceae bacterium TaxID=349277 RepID=A0A6J4RRR0_9ACTN|nr:MAG: diguanylate cyclase/phosphodiesterase (GGDEF & EAL domains) with PAS/PAC sensor(s) [uncultured Rubrobacteraceae bacterium]
MPGLDRLLGHLRRGAAAYGVLLISLLLTALAWYYVRDTVEKQSSVRFDETVRATQAAVDRRTDDYLDAMFGARGLVLASDSVDPPEWEEYVKGVEPGTRLKGLQALAFAERVEPSEREGFIRRLEEGGLPGLRPDLEPGGERDVYFPISLAAPADEANREMFGRDDYPYTVYRAAMDRARDTGSPQATETTYVLTENPPGATADLARLQGFVVYLPVYEAGEPAGNVAERRRALRGFVVGAFRRDGLLDAVFGGGFDPAIDFEVYDGREMESSALLYDSDGIERAEAGGDELFSKRRLIEVAGRDWSLYFATLPRFEREVQSNLPLFVLAAGLGVGLLLFGISWMLVRSRLRAERASEDLEDVNRELEGTNRELEAFSYSVSHDLRAPLRTIDGFSQILSEDYGDKLDEEGLDYLTRVRTASRHMAELIDDLLDLSRVGRRPLRRESVDLSALAAGVAEDLKGAEPGRDVDFVIEGGVTVRGDVGLLKVALENLLGNAWKFTSREPRATIRFGNSGGAFYVSDDGAGFEDAYKDKLFGAFQRLHGPEEFEGTGIGLATVARIVHRHGGEVWAEGAVGEGATFFFTLGGRDRPKEESVARRREPA